MSDKGSLSEKMGRKATGLSPCFTVYGSRFAGQIQYLHGMYFARCINLSVDTPPKKDYSGNKKDNKMRRYVCDV